MIRLNKTQVLIFMLIVLGSAGNAQNLFNAENSKKFARYLFSTQQYKLAANEYERILTLEPNDTIVYAKLLQSYRLGNICETSFRNLGIMNITNFFDNDLISSEFLKLALTCDCCYRETDFSRALSSLDFNKRTFYRLGRFVFSEQKDSLISFANKNRNLLQTEYPDVFAKVEALENYKRKKPGLAALMSAIIPGSGKAYTGYWGDAAMSLIFVSTNAWLSYKGFHKKGIKSANGWIFGSLSMGFYLGNIWGSGKAAKTYNRIQYEKMYNEAKGSIHNHF